MHFGALPLRGLSKRLQQKKTHPSGRFSPHDPDLAAEKRERMAVTPFGSIFDVSKMTPKEIADNVEMLVPLIRPYGCGPLSDADEAVLRTYDRILEMRNETRFDDRGLSIGDRTFKRMYQQAMRSISRYSLASPELQKAADAANMDGIRIVFTKSIHTTVVDGKEIRHPEIRKASDSEIADGLLLSPQCAVQHHFKYINDKMWHRYLFPFGCYFVDRPTEMTNGWKEWANGMICPATKMDVLINPYSVLAADVLYLCNTTGYMERFVYNLNILRWAMESHSCNLLRYYKHDACKTDAEYRAFVSLERLYHVFGSIHMHKSVIHKYSNQVCGPWQAYISDLSDVETALGVAFNIKPASLAEDFNNMLIRKPRNLNTLQQVFPAATYLGNRK